MMKKVFGLIIMSMALSACYKDKEQLLYPNDFLAVDTTNVTYTKDIQSLVANRCSGGLCHVSGTQIPNLSTYAFLTANILRVKARAIDRIPTAMPTTGLSIGDRARLSAWINQGLKN